MTIYEAIKAIKNELLCVSRQTEKGCERECGKCDLALSDDVILSAYDMALSALRTQQEAEKNENSCKFCHDGEAIGLDMCNDEITIETDGSIHIMGGGDWELQINYCPMCGRQLRHPPKEAHDGANT